MLKNLQQALQTGMDSLTFWKPIFSSKVSSSNAASTPTQAATAAAGATSTAPAQADLDLFGESGGTTKAEDAAKKPLSKDSILSLYGTNSMSQPAAAGEEERVNRPRAVCSSPVVFVKEKQKCSASVRFTGMDVV